MRRYISVLFLTLLCIPITSFQTDEHPQYLRVRLEKEMQVNDLLEIYQLHDYECNLTQFEKLNTHIKSNTLAEGKELNLPILLYAFNDKNIRSSVGIDNLDIAKSIQKYNEDLLKAGIRRKSYKESGYIFVPHHLLNCTEKKKPALQTLAPATTEGSEKERLVSNTMRRYSIFGRKYQDVPIIDKKLKGKIFYVEAGHGGPDPGAMTKVSGRTLCEDEYAYDISLRIARSLIQHSATVFLITRDPNDGIRDSEFLLCDSDERTFPDLKIPAPHKTRLFQRSDAVNELYEKFRKKGVTDQRLIVVHVDSRGKREQIDTFLYYQSGNEDSHKLAKKMQRTLEDKYARYRDYNGTLSTRDLHMLRETKPTTVFVEIGNIRNEFDRKRIMVANNRKAIANWLAEGFMK